MTTLGSLALKEVTRLLKDAGRRVVLRRMIEGTYDASSGAMTGKTEINYVGQGAFLQYRGTEIDDTKVKRGDRKCLLQARGLTAVPDVGDRIVTGTLVQTIVTVELIELNGIVLVYVLQVRTTGGR